MSKQEQANRTDSRSKLTDDELEAWFESLPDVPPQEIEEIDKIIHDALSKVVTTTTKQRPQFTRVVITLPKDEVRVKQLQLKRDEYKGRLDPYRAPELQQVDLFKYHVLNALVEDGRIDSWDLSLVMAELVGRQVFDPQLYSGVISLIEDYAVRGGTSNPGGTGLPAI